MFEKYYGYLIAFVSLLAFAILRIAFGSNLILFLAVPLVAVASYCGATFVFDKQQEKLHSSKEYQQQLIIESQKAEFSSCLDELRTLRDENDSFWDIVDQFISKVDAFSDKDSALNRLIRMNNNEKKDFLQNCSNSANGFIIGNAKKLIKCLIAYNAQSKENRPESIEDVQAVKDVLKGIDDLTVKYDQLLNEVVRLGDDFDIEDPGLRYAVENLQELRVRNEDEVVSPVKSDNGIHLFVTPTE